jgi:metal-responsive CopG/Arc/MetJ family transcriptional regulator
MKTAISLPDDLFESVERLVRRSGRHRSEVYADALREYVARHSPDEITDSWNAVLEELGDSAGDPAFTNAAAQQVLKRAEW